MKTVNLDNVAMLHIAKSVQLHSPTPEEMIACLAAAEEIAIEKGCNGVFTAGYSSDCPVIGLVN